jgi:hypothetical protein
MIHPLFIVGNKRSGTSHLVRVLNLHPQVFVSHESDIAWILYQFHRDRAFRAHAWDSDRGMRVTLATARHLLRREASPSENFVAVQRAVMEAGSPWLPAQQKSGLLWIGDKKPMQHTDPELLAFLLRHFPTARFLHIVRHPFAVAASSDRFNRTADGDFWLGLSTHEKVERWTFHEQQVLQLRRDMPGRVHTLRYEDFCRRPERELANVFRFLQLEPDPRVLREAAAQNRPAAGMFPALRCSAATQSVAAAYGYELPARTMFRNLTQNVVLRAARKFGA